MEPRYLLDTNTIDGQRIFERRGNEIVLREKSGAACSGDPAVPTNHAVPGGASPS